MSTRLYQLDALRGLAAVSVVVCHCLNVPSAFDDTLLAYLFTNTPLAIVSAGHEAVMLFFFLSGFVLFLPYLTSVPSYRGFIVKRFCRIYLPYYAAVLVAVLLALTVSRGGIPELGRWFNLTWTTPVTWTMIADHLLLIGTFPQATLNTAFWSLVHEMRISLLFPLLAAIVLRLNWKHCLAVCVMTAIGSYAVFVIGHQVLRCQTDYYLTVHYLGIFLAGGLLAKHHVRCAEWFSRLSPWGKVSALALAVCIYTSKCWLPITLDFHGSWYLYDWASVAGSALFVTSVLASGRLARWLTSAPLRFLGNISFSIYLFHGSILFALLYLCYARIPMWQIWLLTLLSTLLLSTITYYAVEVPSMKLGRLFANNVSPIVHSCRRISSEVTAQTFQQLLRLW